MRFLPFHIPEIGDDEITAVTRILRSGWLTTGPETRRFEQAFANFMGAPAALALSSGTAALHLALVTLGVGRDDAVITSAMTFCSAVHVIEHVGATPILVDVDPETLNMNPTEVARALEAGGTHRVRAIMPVHLYGHPCDLDTLLELGMKYELTIIEDAAHALPAKYHGRMVGAPVSADGAPPVLTAFSFYATKNLTTGEGGMLTGSPELVEEARIWSLHGMSSDAWKRYDVGGSWFYEVVRPGFKYNMTDLQAAIGLQQLRKLLHFQARRRAIARRYTEAFSRVTELQVPTERPEVDHAWHLYVLRLHLDRLTVSRDRFIDELRRRNIGTSVHFIPAHLHAYYRERYGFHPQDFPVASREYGRIISLPLYPSMSDEDVEDVIQAVGEVIEAHRR